MLWRSEIMRFLKRSAQQSTTNMVEMLVASMHSWRSSQHYLDSCRLAHLTFSASEQLSITLQSKNITVPVAMITVNMAKQFYTSNTGSCHHFNHQWLQSPEGRLHDSPVLPRYRRVQLGLMLAICFRILKNTTSNNTFRLWIAVMKK